MGIFINHIHLLTLLLLTVPIWTANIKINNNLQNGILQNNDENEKTPAGGILTGVDQRISDIIAQNVLQFGHNLGIKLTTLDPHATSEIFSPLSLMTALSMLTLGAKGKSYQQLKQILGIDSDSELIHNPKKYYQEFGLMLNDLQHININNSRDVNKRPNAKWRSTKTTTPSIRRSSHIKEPVEEPIIKVANGFFVQNDYTLNPDYIQVLQSIYATQLTDLDFKSRSREATDHINAWINNATYGKISKLFDVVLEPSTSIVLASTLYFKAVWETTFIDGLTNLDNFYPNGQNNPPIKVQLMGNAGIFPFYDAKEYDCRIIGFPYKGNETTMYVIQPNDSSRQKLRNLQHVLDAHKINGMIDNMVYKTTMLVFPKMHFKRKLHMKNILQTMNVNDIFVNGKSDLSLIGKGKQTASLTAQAFSESVPVSFESIYRRKPGPDANNSTESAMNVAGKPSMAVTFQSSNKREKRQVSNFSSNLHASEPMALLNLESDRQKDDPNRSDLYVDDFLHNVDFFVNEKGTEAAAATAISLLRSGTEVIFRCDTPFLIVIRHDPTKLPLFYGIINQPEL